ncbi:hypothetical protein KBB08_03935 [Candidatus Gracilibacteria bacterium]|nr:hypothetical protein [Candidatus Gracilibacteria bacterium]
MSYGIEEAHNTLKYVSQMSVRGSLVMRYLLNPHVTRKDSVHEHIARIVRFATILLPVLRHAFRDDDAVLSELNHLQTIVSCHDDEEILAMEDIATFVKAHGAADADEVAKVRANLASVTEAEREYLVEKFALFRQRKTLSGAPRMVADIAKVLDNLVGNQLAIEDKVGMIHPDYVIACLRYVQDYEGKVCDVIDQLISAQVREILAVRAAYNDEGQIEALVGQWVGEGKGVQEALVRKVRQQLAVDVTTHVFDNTRSYVPVWEYQVLSD